MGGTYWLDLFTAQTWDEFLDHGAKVSGFRETRRATCRKVAIGDIFLCYVTGISRFIGALKVVSKAYEDSSPIWSDDVFPIRFEVEAIVTLPYDQAVPVLELKDRLKVFSNLRNPKLWSGAFRGSPRAFPSQDGALIIEELQEQQTNPVIRKVDQKRLYKPSMRRPEAVPSQRREVTIPVDPETEEMADATPESTRQASIHTEIQWLLLKLGSDMGLDVWVARNDRSRTFDGQSFSSIERLISTLPTLFADDGANRTVELIDVLWLDQKTIVAAFEIESTTSIFSGLLRMSDLVSAQPNISIPLFIVAPEERRERVMVEVNRPTFVNLKTPLDEICRYISFETLRSEVREHQGVTKYLKPEYVYNELSESCALEDL